MKRTDELEFCDRCDTKIPTTQQQGVFRYKEGEDTKLLLCPKCIKKPLWRQSGT